RPRGPCCLALPTAGGVAGSASTPRRCCPPIRRPLPPDDDPPRAARGSRQAPRFDNMARLSFRSFWSLICRRGRHTGPSRRARKCRFVRALPLSLMRLEDLTLPAPLVTAPADQATLEGTLTAVG